MGSGPLQFNQPEEDTLAVVLSGNWKLGEALPSAEEVKSHTADFSKIRRIVFDSRLLADWDSGLLIFLAQLKELCEPQQTIIDDGGLPQGAKRLMAMAAAVPEKKDARRMEGRVPFLLHVGNETAHFFRSAGDLLSFIGDAVLALERLLHGKARFRKADLWLMVEACGA
jgi:phospholipid/cholesterol/gamma-HCH transport system permease protein